MLTARDIRNLKNSLKKKTLGGGYDVAEVDLQLTTLAERWEALQEEKRMAEERADDLAAKLKHYEKVELALQEALETARDTARRTEEDADRKARLIIEEAELRAQRIVQDVEQERFGLRQDLSTLTNRQNEVAARLRSFLMSELEILAQFQGEDPVGFIKLVAPERSESERSLGAYASPTPLPPPASLEAGGTLMPPAAEADVTAPEASGEPYPEVPSADEFLTGVSGASGAMGDAPGAAEGAAAEGAAAEGASAEGDATEGASAPRRSIPRSPWLDVDTPATPPVWERTGEATPSDATAPEAAAPEAPSRAAPGWTSPAAFSASGDTPDGEGTADWSLRSLVTGDDAAPDGPDSDANREKIRRILDDLD